MEAMTTAPDIADAEEPSVNGSFLGEAVALTPSALLPPLSPELPSSVPDRVRSHPLLSEDAWVAHRDSGREPFDCSELTTTLDTRVEFLVGAWLIDKIVPPSLGGSLLDNLQPQMLREADVLNTGKRRTAILMPRRSSKTTTLWCVLLGRCYMRPMHMAGYSMLTTAKKTTERFRLDLFAPITAAWPDPKTRPVKLINSNGFERVEFPNHSVLAILSPEGDAIRSGAYDTLVLDEAGEPEPDKWGIVTAAVLPAFDTRGPHAQVVLAGTGGRYRDGSYFWKQLHSEKAARLRYGVPDDIDAAALRDWETAGPLIERLHPGLDGLTTLEIIEDNFHDMPDTFAAEYFGYFPDEYGPATALSQTGWKRGRDDAPPPEGITAGALALAVHPLGHWASIVIAWHERAAVSDLAAQAWALDGDDTPPRPAFKLIHHQRGVQGIERALLLAARRTGLPITYDHGTSQSRAVVERILGRARPKPAVTALNFGDAKVAAAQFVASVEQGIALHWDQKPLDEAARTAVLKTVGQGYLIRPADDASDVTPLEAAAAALYTLPDVPRVAITPDSIIDFGAA